MPPEPYSSPNGSRSPPPARPPPVGNGSSGSRTPLFDNTTYILIILVVVIPVVFTIVLCAITYCIYRYNKSRTDRAPTNCPIVSANRSGVPIATIIYNTQHSPFIFEDAPPSYDSLAEIKKDSHGTTRANTNEQFPLTVLPNTTLTNPNEEVTAAAATAKIPSAPIQPPPPPYVNIDELNK